MSKYSSESDSNHTEDHYRKKKNVTKSRGRSDISLMTMPFTFVKMSKL